MLVALVVIFDERRMGDDRRRKTGVFGIIGTIHGSSIGVCHSLVPKSYGAVECGVRDFVYS